MASDSGPLQMTDILGMVLSGNTIFIHYGLSKPRLAAVSISLGGSQTLSPVDVGATMKLVPVLNNNGVALVNLVSDRETGCMTVLILTK
jgi:hypothetical protein